MINIFNSFPLKRIITVLSLGYIFFYFSELLFWARYKPEDTLVQYIITWLAYSMLAYIFILIIDYTKIRTLLGLYLVGLIFGWLAEGLIVYTMYDAFPFQIAWTGMAWHALLSVLMSIYLMFVITNQPINKIILITLFIGLFFGFWSIWWKIEDGESISLFQNLTYFFISTTGLMISFIGFNLNYHVGFKASKIEYFLIILFISTFTLAAVIAIGWVLIILPIAICIPLSGILINMKKNQPLDDQFTILKPKKESPIKCFIFTLSL